MKLKLDDIDVEIELSGVTTLTGTDYMTMGRIETKVRKLCDDNVAVYKYPESGRHPQYYKFYAKMVATLANEGILVLIRTHSDFILSGINTLVALHSRRDWDGVEALLKSEDIPEMSLLPAAMLTGYEVTNKSVVRLDTSMNGVAYPSIDSVTTGLNSLWERIEFL